MLVPFRCPICEGRGKVPLGFYDRMDSPTTPLSEKCRTCDGSGLFHAFAPDPFQPVCASGGHHA